MPISFNNFVANGTVTVNAQPNITSVGTLTSLNCSGNVNFTGSNVSLGSDSTIRITGGNAGYTLTTYGNGTVVWQDNDPDYIAKDYTICQIKANIYTAPVYANSTSTRNIPLIFVGNTIADLWPYGNGSATANAVPGYTVGSTAPFQPAAAAALSIPDTTDSFDGWFKLISSNTNAAFNRQIIFNMQCYSNVANTEIQLCPFVNNDANSSINQLNTNQISVFDVKELPKQTNINIVYPDSFSNSVVRTGYYIRNITPNSEVTVTFAVLDQIEII